MKRSHHVIIAFTLLLAIGFATLFSTRVHAAAAPSLLHNDERWYRDGTACLEVVNGIFYVPVNLFGALPSMEVSIDSRRGEFLVYNRAAGQYISALFEEKMATVNGEEEVYLNFYKLHGGYFYVPVEYFCSVLGISCEIKVSSSTPYGVSLRIADGAQTKTMEELLSAYDPVATEPPPTSFIPPTTETTPPSVTTDRDKVYRQYYFVFNTISSDGYSNLLATLSELEVPAAFFFTMEELREYPDRVLAAVVANHTVALRVNDSPAPDTVLSAIEQANDRLCRITKLTTRIVQCAEEGGFREETKTLLQEAGYIVWDWTYDVPDSQGYALSYVESICQRAMVRREFNVLRMSCNDTVVRLIPRLVAFIEDSPLYSLSRITHAATPLS